MKKAFTLLEICIAMALLSLIGGALGWQVKGVLRVHKFHTSMEHFLVELKKLQVIAMTHRADLVVRLTKTDKGYEYAIVAHEPLCRLKSRTEKLKEVEKITREGRSLPQVEIQIYPSGVIEPVGGVNLVFVCKNREVELDTTRPLRITLSRKINISKKS